MEWALHRRPDADEHTQGGDLARSTRLEIGCRPPLGKA
jgi:hypothetical protein